MKGVLFGLQRWLPMFTVMKYQHLKTRYMDGQIYELGLGTLWSSRQYWHTKACFCFSTDKLVSRYSINHCNTSLNLEGKRGESFFPPSGIYLLWSFRGNAHSSFWYRYFQEKAKALGSEEDKVPGSWMRYEQMREVEQGLYCAWLYLNYSLKLKYEVHINNT